MRRPATARAAWRAARASSGPRRSSSASCSGIAQLAHARARDRDLERRQRAAREDRGVRDLVDDRQPAIEAVADQHGVVALHDHAGDAVAALAGRAQVRGGVLEVLVQDDREHRVGARVAVQLGQPPQAPAGGTRARRRLADRAHDGVAREVELLQAPELDEAGVDRIELRQQQAVDGSPSRRSARATSSLTPAAQAVEPFAPVVAARHTPRKSGAAPGVSRATASSVVELPTSTPATSIAYEASPRRT